MRTLTLNGATISYPDKRIFSSTPNFVKITDLADGAKVLFSFSGVTVSRYADVNNEIMFPLQGALESFFKSVEFGDVDYTGDEAVVYNSGSKSIQLDATITIQITDSADLEFDVIYGAIQRGESEPSSVEVYKYGSLPFSVTQNIGDRFKVGVTETLGFGKEILLTNSESDKVEILQDSTVVRTYNIVSSGCTEGIYLRWLSLLDGYKYDLIPISQDEISGKTNGTFNHDINDLTPSENGLIKGSTIVKNIQGSQSITGGIIADENRKKHIDTLVLAKDIWMYINNVWLEVTKADMTVVKKRTDGNLEIAIKIILPDLFTPTR